MNFVLYSLLHGNINFFVCCSNFSYCEAFSFQEGRNKIIHQLYFNIIVCICCITYEHFTAVKFHQLKFVLIDSGIHMLIDKDKQISLLMLIVYYEFGIVLFSSFL